MKPSKTNPFKRIESAGFRLAQRKILFWKLRMISDITLGTAMIGIVLMIFETELILTGLSSPDDPMTFFVKLATSSSTIILLGFLLWYHVTDIKLNMNDNFVDSWFLMMNPRRLASIGLEFVVCSIHPPPSGFNFTSGEGDRKNELDSSASDFDYTKWQSKYSEGVEKMTLDAVPLDMYLSVLMFLRGYLLCRAVVLHSRLCNDASLQSLGAMNRIRFTFSFIFRSMMLIHPFRILVFLIVVVLVIAAWTLRACDISHLSLPKSLWLILITFLTVGYGDLVPRSYCGQTVAVFTGFFGIGCMALVVAVLIQKLEMSTSERYVHNFVTTVGLQNDLKMAAANILRWTWLSYKARRSRGTYPIDSGLYYYNHRRLMAALHKFRQVKQDKALHSERNVNLFELNNGQRVTTAAVAKLECRMDGVERVAEESLARLEMIHLQLEKVEKLLKAAN